jgi:hypothetical protein
MIPLWPRDPDDPSLWRDLKTGDAGWVPRVGLSLASAGGVIAAGFVLMGLFDLGVGLRDHHVAIGVALAGVAWCASLVFIWATFSRWWRILKTIFFIFAIWVVAIPAGIFVDEVFRSEEFFIAAIIAMALGATVFLLATLSYRRGGGRAIMLRDGVIDVRCPDCGYSLVGLTECICPECGRSLTIDELIRRQNYRAVNRALPPASPPVGPTTVEPPIALPNADALAD